MSMAAEYHAKRVIQNGATREELAAKILELRQEADRIISVHADQFDWIRMAHKLKTEANIYESYLNGTLKV